MMICERKEGATYVEMVGLTLHRANSSVGLHTIQLTLLTGAVVASSLRRTSTGSPPTRDRI